MNSSVETFKTINEFNSSEYKDKGSRFIAIAYPVTHVEQIKDIQNILRKKYINSVHVCYAYRIGYDGGQYRVNDDGEPSGSAGLPILGQIDSFGLTNTTIMVVRYFGGTLLGVTGLIKAYKNVSKQVLSEANIVEKKVYQEVKIECAYFAFNEVMKRIRQTQSEIVQQDLQLQCKLIVNVPSAEYNKFFNYFKHHIAVKIGE